MNRFKKVRFVCSIVALLVFVVFGGLAFRSYQRVQTVKLAIEAAGGSVKLENRVPAYLRLFLGEDNHTFLDETILTEVILDGRDVGDENLKRLADILTPPAAFPNLRSLDFKISNITSEGLEYLRGLKNLRSLNVGFTQVSDLTPIETFTELESLGLYSSQVGDADLKRLENFRNLHTLHAGDLELTDIGLKYVANCSNLRILGLKDTTLSEQGFGYIHQLTRLETLVLFDSKFRGEDLNHFRRTFPKCVVICNELLSKLPETLQSSEDSQPEEHIDEDTSP